MIDPSSLAFDIDGVFADTMTLFLDIAREEYKIRDVKYEDITCYTLEKCVNMDPALIDAILTQIMDGTHKASLKPMPGARNVLTRLGRLHSPILFVTARPNREPIYEWIQSILSFDSDSIDVVATGSFDAKVDVLSTRGISYFVEDRLETCYPLSEAGVTPIIFKQPWNRERHPFVEVGTWKELESLIQF
ncbi:MAG: haloacid dehalogenase [Deltaproteobacteria bacterium]|jgi:5'(3')-deoxyribonucleotidase|nr:haloacid dehalogenase [Deltaproteobacteria bacterium]